MVMIYFCTLTRSKEAALNTLAKLFLKYVFIIFRIKENHGLFT